jgi:tetratricopeptide (TPR) repeat protein
MSMELFLFSAAVGAAITDYIFSTESRIRNKQERELFAKARRYCDTADYRQALPILEQLMEKDPQNPLYCVLAIPCYSKLARIENLRRNLEKCNRLCEYTLSLVRNGAFVSQDVIDAIGAVLQSHKPLLDDINTMAKKIGTVDGSKTKALDYAERMFVLWLANPEVPKLQQKAQTLMDAGKYSEALKCYDKLIKIDPEDGEFYFSRGLCRTKTGDVQGSVKDVKSALASEWLSDKKRKVLKEILTTYEKAPASPFADDPAREAAEDFISGKYDSAIRRLNRLIRLHPERLDYLMLRADCKSGLGSRREAIADLKEVLKHELPDDLRKEIGIRVAQLSS